MLRIILDCDDVLYQTNEAALKRLNEKLGTAYTLGNITKWGKISPDLDYRMEYFQNPDFIQDLPVYDGASEFIACLMKFGDVILATSVSPRCATARLDAIRRDFPMVNPGNVLICNEKSHIAGDFMLHQMIPDAPVLKMTFALSFLMTLTVQERAKQATHHGIRSYALLTRSTD